MPKIVKTSSQENALKDIQENLKILSALNNVVTESGLENCKIRITGTENGNNVNEQFSIPYGQISVTLKDYRKKLVSDISTKSRTFSIVLDENDRAIMDQEKPISPEKEETQY